MEKQRGKEHTEGLQVPDNPAPGPNDTGKDLPAVRIQRIFIILCILLVLIASSVFTWRFTAKNGPTADSVAKTLAGFPVAELAVHEYTFEVFARASENRTGNFGYKVLSAGLLNPDSEVQILYRCGVGIRYGIDLKDLAGRYLVTSDRIDVELPPPTVIGKPRIINIGEPASELIAVKHNNLIKKPDTMELESYIRSRCQELAAAWPMEFGLDRLARDRTRNVIRQTLAGRTGGRKVTVRFEDEVDTQ